MFRRRKAVEEGPARDEVPARWRSAVLDCDRTIAELRRVADGARPGPMRDRLEELRTEVAGNLATAVAATVRAGEVERLTGTIDLTQITTAFKAARREVEAAGQRGPVPDALQRSLDSLRRQHDSANRLLNSLEETDRHLDALRRQLTELLLTAAELALGTSGEGLALAQGQAEAIAAEADELRRAFAELA